jgi:DUF2075 family protein
MKSAFYKNSIANFQAESPESILGALVKYSDFDVIKTQREAWLYQIEILKSSLVDISEGSIYFEYSIPRMGRRIDVVLVLNSCIYVVEFKVGDSVYSSAAIDQVWDYALDLKNFHSTSHDSYIIPVLIATEAVDEMIVPQTTHHNDKVITPIKANKDSFRNVFPVVQKFIGDCALLTPEQWEIGRYNPTPTIVEAASALYRGHSVASISRSDAGATNLIQTTEIISSIITESKAQRRKSICFVTGVPGAGKTLVGLNVAHKHIDKASDLYSVYLSGNGPLIAILREALARDKVAHEKEKGNKITKKDALREVSLFIQNVHHFRDDCLRDKQPPVEHVALFDEAQRAWNKHQTVDFMKRKKSQLDFNQSEPEFLISCLDRHQDWATIVCLVGGGQEINTGEGGITEWISCLNTSFPEWDIHISSRLIDTEYGAGSIIKAIQNQKNIFFSDGLHLGVSMRSFRSEKVSELIKKILDIDVSGARVVLDSIGQKYPIVITRDIKKAKEWVKQNARGNERYGMIVSSQAERLRPHAIFVKATVDPVHWFLDEKNDVRSSYYLEDVATEFDIQGLELDWSCVVWDGDFRFHNTDWEHRSFVGSKWQHIHKEERKTYQKNAYRVLLTRARQGMVIVVPEGDGEDPTRQPEMYDSTYNYLKEIGFTEI